MTGRFASARQSTRRLLIGSLLVGIMVSGTGCGAGKEGAIAINFKARPKMIVDLNAIDSRLGLSENVDKASLDTCTEIRNGASPEKVAETLRHGFGDSLNLSDGMVLKIRQALMNDLCGTV